VTGPSTDKRRPLSIVRRASALRIVSQANVNWLERPDRLSRAVLASLVGGSGPAGALLTGAARYPNAPAVVDEAGAVTYRELARRSLRLGAALRRQDAGPGVVIGVMARNHRGFVEMLAGAASTGADVVLVNTGFAAAELRGVVASEAVKILLHDDEFADAAAACGADVVLGERAIDELVDAAPTALRARRAGRIVVLTSGTTGRAKGAARGGAGAVEAAAAILDRIPLRVRDTQVVAAPLFHAWGLLHILLGLSRSATTVLHRRFDPAVTLDAVGGHQARALIVVPVMLKRILDLGPDALVRADTSSLAVIASSGSALGVPLATEVLRRFGPILYNVYGSTEVALATIAGPGDLQRWPGTAGRVAFGSRVEILDDGGDRLPPGVTGRVFVGNGMGFDGYTSGEDKERRRGLVASGDRGHFDDDGRLFIDGREDDMVVSGGENVFPGEVEDVLHSHPGVADVAVVGVPDDEFGEALTAFVVQRPGFALTADDIRDHVRASLARYKVPRRVEFRSELPRTPTGKVLRRKLVAS
jgi:fatty-acyl-CoA synthase